MAEDELNENPTPDSFGRRRRGRKLEIDWIEKHPEIYRQYAGEAIVVEGEAVVAHARDLDDFARQVRQLSLQHPFVLRIPELEQQGLPYI